jgi:hypothetical protein
MWTVVVETLLGGWRTGAGVATGVRASNSRHHPACCRAHAWQPCVQRRSLVVTTWAVGVTRKLLCSAPTGSTGRSLCLFARARSPDLPVIVGQTCKCAAVLVVVASQPGEGLHMLPRRLGLHPLWSNRLALYFWVVGGSVSSVSKFCIVTILFCGS